MIVGSPETVAEKRDPRREISCGNMLGLFQFGNMPSGRRGTHAATPGRDAARERGCRTDSDACGVSFRTGDSNERAAGPKAGENQWRTS
jgi:hypothetical protein